MEDPSFEVVGEAENGVAASEFLKQNEVDVMTLDIHMPVQNGLEYMKNNYSSSHPRVVVISGASREDAVYSKEILRAGASDFVEKPTMANFAEKSEEIRAKVKLSLFSDSPIKGTVDEFSGEEKIIYNVSSKLRAFLFPYSSLRQLKVSLSEKSNYKYNQPPTVLFLEGSEILFDEVCEELSDMNVEILTNSTTLSCNKMYLTSVDSFVKSLSFSSVALGIFGPYLTKYNKLLDLIDGKKQVLLEETGTSLKESNPRVTDIVPATSFYHVASEFLSEIGESNDN